MAACVVLGLLACRSHQPPSSDNNPLTMAACAAPTTESSWRCKHTGTSTSGLPPLAAYMRQHNPSQLAGAKKVNQMEHLLLQPASSTRNTRVRNVTGPDACAASCLAAGRLIERPTPPPPPPLPPAHTHHYHDHTRQTVSTSTGGWVGPLARNQPGATIEQQTVVVCNKSKQGEQQARRCVPAGM